MRKAFTLIELLVVIFIITFLIAIIVPAVQGAREAARRIQCTNNQKNLATGLIHYENTRGSLPGWREFIPVALPPGLMSPAGWQSGDEIVAQASWVFSILPYIEQTDLFERLRTGQVAAREEEPTRQIPSIALLHCPSHTESPRSRAMNYVVNGGAVDNFRSNPTPDGNVANGPFLDRAKIVAGLIPQTCACPNRCRYDQNAGRYRNAVARLADISRMDGTSNTMLTSENAQRGFWISEDIVHFYNNRAGVFPRETPDVITPNDWIRLPEPDNRWTVRLTGIEDTIEGSVAFCWPRYYFDPAATAWICQIAYPRAEHNVSGNMKQGFSHPPDDPSVFVFDRTPYDSARIPVWLNSFTRKTFGDSWYQSARPSSNHAAVVIVSFADGNVRRINDSIDERVFVQLMTAGAGQSDAGWRFPQNSGDQNFLYGRLFNSPF